MCVQPNTVEGISTATSLGSKRSPLHELRGMHTEWRVTWSSMHDAQGVILACISFSLNWEVEAGRASAAVHEANEPALEVEFTRIAQDDPDPRTLEP